MKKIGRLIYRHLKKNLFILGILLSITGVILGLFVPKVIGQFLDRHFLVDLLDHPIKLIGYLSLFILINVIKVFGNYLICRVGNLAIKEVQVTIYSDLLHSEVSALDHFQSGDIASRLTNDMSAVLNFITVVLPNLFMNVLILLGSIYFLWTISSSLTLMSLLLMPLIALVMVPMSHKLENSYSNYQKGLGDISSRISHKFTHFRLMKAFQGEESELHSMTGAFDRLALSFENIIKYSVVQHSLVSSLMMGLIILMLLVAGMEVTNGVMTIATLTTFVLYMMQLIEPVIDMVSSLNELTEFKAISKRLVELLEQSKEEQPLTELMIQDASIQLKNVHFSYNEDQVLNGLSVEIPAGSHVAVVGPSGAGKSTIFSLLMKFYEDYLGDILIGGHSLSSISAKQVRSMISYIPQDNTLFQGTIRENLIYGKNEAVSEERICFILKELGLNKLVSEMEQGLDTQILENGAGLSEGQKQRLNIARALLLEHPIYLLDEVTASLDSVTEHIISKAIDRLTVGKTRLTIAHRLHTVKGADAILVLDKNGQVSDYGNHQQLLTRSHLYNDFLRNLPNAS